MFVHLHNSWAAAVQRGPRRWRRVKTHRPGRHRQRRRRRRRPVAHSFRQRPPFERLEPAWCEGAVFCQGGRHGWFAAAVPGAGRELLQPTTWGSGGGLAAAGEAGKPGGQDHSGGGPRDGRRREGEETNTARDRTEKWTGVRLLILETI